MASVRKFKSPEHRLQILGGIKNSIVIDDSYNSSPVACEAALELLSKFKNNRWIAVLGSMKELGVNTEEAHRLIGKDASKVAKVLFLAKKWFLPKKEAEKQKRS